MSWKNLKFAPKDGTPFLCRPRGATGEIDVPFKAHYDTDAKCFRPWGFMRKLSPILYYWDEIPADEGPSPEILKPSEKTNDITSLATYEERIKKIDGAMVRARGLLEAIRDMEEMLRNLDELNSIRFGTVDRPVDGLIGTGFRIGLSNLVQSHREALRRLLEYPE